MPAPATSRKVVYAALAGNVAIALTKFVAAAYTGSSAMLSEGIHSLVDSANELLLLHGLKQAARPANDRHPFGHGRELYFWSFIVALLVFALGALASIYQGLHHLQAPEAIRSPLVNYAVLGASMLFEGGSSWVAFKEFRAEKGEMGYIEAFKRSKDAVTITVLLENVAALVGLAIAMIGITLAQWLQIPEFDGVASIGIGLTLALTALVLARETKALLIGETARSQVAEAIGRIAGEDEAIRTANGVLTVQMGPDQVVAALSAEFEDNLTTGQIESSIRRIETRIKELHPEVTALFVKPQTPETWQQTQTRGAPGSTETAVPDG
jgi:cation diffusion facilitator family transporter